MAENPISVAFEATAETGQAEAQMGRMGASVESTFVPSCQKAGSAATTAGVQAEAAMDRTTNGIRQSTAAAIMLEQRMGIHLPRGINTMLARTELIGPALQYAFSAVILVYFAEHIGTIINKIGDAALAIGGFGEEAQRAFQESIKASDEALTHFQGLTLQAKIATGWMLIAQTNTALAAIAQAKASDQAANSLELWLRRLGMQGPLMTAAAWHQKSLNELTGEEARLQQVLIKQQGRWPNSKKSSRTKMRRNAKAARDAAAKREAEVVREGKDLEALIKKNEEAAKRFDAAWKQVIDKEIELRQKEKDWGDFQRARLEDEQVEITNLAMKGWDPAVARMVIDMKVMDSALGRQFEQSRALVTQLQDRELPARQKIELQYTRQIAAAQREYFALQREARQHSATREEMIAIDQLYTDTTLALSAARQLALDSETAAQAENMQTQIAGFLQVLGLRRAAAIVEAYWETAKAYAAFALHQYWEGTQHLLAAATYIICAAKAGGGGGGPGEPGLVTAADMAGQPKAEPTQCPAARRRAEEQPGRSSTSPSRAAWWARAIWRSSSGK